MNMDINQAFLRAEPDDVIAYGSSFDGKVWRLLTGKDAKIIYEWTPEEREE